jgi:hypothetical protein
MTVAGKDAAGGLNLTAMLHAFRGGRSKLRSLRVRSISREVGSGETGLLRAPESGAREGIRLGVTSVVHFVLRNCTWQFRAMSS